MKVQRIMCDMTSQPATQTVQFMADGLTYEIDLADQPASELADFLAPYVARARRVSTSRGVRTAKRAQRSGAARLSLASSDGAASVPAPHTAGSNGAGATKVAGGDVRAWARTQGIEVGDRGRIPADVVARYLAAGHGEAAELAAQSSATSTSEGKAPRRRMPAADEVLGVWTQTHDYPAVAEFFGATVTQARRWVNKARAEAA